MLFNTPFAVLPKILIVEATLLLAITIRSIFCSSDTETISPTGLPDRITYEVLTNPSCLVIPIAFSNMCCDCSLDNLSCHLFHLAYLWVNRTQMLKLESNNGVDLLHLISKVQLWTILIGKWHT